MKSIYTNPLGRAAIVFLQRTGIFHLVSLFLKSGWSKNMIPGYIKKHRINMLDFQGQEYASFAEFFARKRDVSSYVWNPEWLISPCDSLLSIYKITDDLVIPMKGSYYRLCDLVPSENVIRQFQKGLCLVFRLQASDYHHFCAFDDLIMGNANYIPGNLHSVQPIACEKVPVYRLNRRWWSLMDCLHFGRVIQIEVGAMLVGGVQFAQDGGVLERGDEMGNFELAGSTIILLLTPQIRERLRIEPQFADAYNGLAEKRVRMGDGIGVLGEKDATGIIKRTDPVIAWRSGI